MQMLQHAERLHTPVARPYRRRDPSKFQLRHHIASKERCFEHLWGALALRCLY